MATCSRSHYWAREISRLGHTARLIPPTRVKPFVDAVDAKAICEAARPRRRGRACAVPIKDEEQQANGVEFRVRDLLVHQHTQCINALWGHPSDCSYVLPQGITHGAIPIAHAEDQNTTLLDNARTTLQIRSGPLPRCGRRSGLVGARRKIR
jgi:hypothetical protein